MKGRNMDRAFKSAIAIMSALILGNAATSLAEGCTTEKCHPKMGKDAYVHGPVAAGQCAICHQQSNANHPSGGKNDFKLAENGGKELCFSCHERSDQNPVVHKPVQKGDCTACHDPHGSSAELMLKKATTAELCYSCHDASKAKKAVVHGPVAAGDCNVCHNPHSSQNKGLTEAAGSELCLQCHIDRMEEFQRKYVHKPVEKNCSECHDAHGSDNPFMLMGDGKTLCFKCHTRVKEHIDNSAVKHTALKEGACTKCHTPHSSNYPRQLKSPAKDVCYVCHDKMGVQVATAKNLHGPVQQNDCYACHDPHGSNYTKVLKKDFPATFYMPYKTENYAMCFDCHNKDIALTQFTTKLTDFRNGDTNMHFLHVNKEKGRSCKACHEVHAGDQNKHIRREVPFGKKWPLPIQFTKTPTGGNCVVGCHKPKDYDREKPVTY